MKRRCSNKARATGWARRHAPARRRGAGPAWRSRTSCDASRCRSGAFPCVHFAVHKDERLQIGDAQSSPATRSARCLQRCAQARRGDGRRGGRRLRVARVPAAALTAEPGAQAPESPPGLPRAEPQGLTTRPATRHAIAEPAPSPRSFQPAVVATIQPPGTQPNLAPLVPSTACQHRHTELPSAVNFATSPGFPEQVENSELDDRRAYRGNNHNVPQGRLFGDLNETGGVSTNGLLTVRDGQTMTTDLHAQVGWSRPRLAGIGLGSAPRRYAAGWPVPSTSQPGLAPPRGRRRGARSPPQPVR